MSKLNIQVSTVEMIITYWYCVSKGQRMWQFVENFQHVLCNFIPFNSEWQSLPEHS
jgi:hypothetical protein